MARRRWLPAVAALSSLLWLLPWPLLAAVKLEGAAVPGGVRYAADQVEAVTKAPVATQVGGEGLPPKVAGNPEAFSLAPEGPGFKVRAATAAGLMYGLLELRDRIKAGQPPTELVVSAPALRLRGDTVDFPFYLGVDLYNGRWGGSRPTEGKADSWWLDKGHWAWRLRRCAELRMNALLICHPHPFPGLIDLPDMPEAAYFPPEHLKRLQEQFTWILDQAEQWGVKVYLLTWNIWVSPGFAKAHKIAQEGPDGELVRRYTRACYRRTFETYPKLAGVMTMAGEAPPGCVDFVREAIVAGLNELPRPPELMFWTWCCYPEDARGVFQAYKGPSRVVHYLQYEQLFRPQADPRIKRTSEALGGIPVVTLGGLGTATGWLYWSDPFYIRGIMADLPRQNGDGCFFAGLDSFAWVSEKWLGWEGLARYWWDPDRGRPVGTRLVASAGTEVRGGQVPPLQDWWDPDRGRPVGTRLVASAGTEVRAGQVPPLQDWWDPDRGRPVGTRLVASAGTEVRAGQVPPLQDGDRSGDLSYWRKRIGEHFGAPEVAEDFLQASISASSVPTRLLALLHRQTDHFMPQFSLPLTQYLGLPTLSTYVFENHERIDQQGRLWPRLGLTWPNPDWGEKVIGVVDYVAGKRGGTTPPQIAEELQRAAEDTLTRVARLRAFAGQVSGGADKWGKTLDQMTMNAYLGLHTAEKVRAAIGWERWRRGQADAAEVLGPLERSVRAMESMAQVAEKLYPGIQMEEFRPGISRPWPWTNLQIWQSDRNRKFTFTDGAVECRSELEWIRREMAAGYPQPLLPFEDDLAPRPRGAKLLVRWDGEGAPPAGLKLNSFGEVARATVGPGQGPAPIAGSRVVADHGDENFWFPLTSDPATLPLKIGRAYRVSMDYWIARDVERLGEWLSAGARTTKGGWPNDIGARYMGGPAGTRGKITLAFTPHTWDDFYLYVSIHGPGRIELDNIEVWEATP